MNKLIFAGLISLSALLAGCQSNINTQDIEQETINTATLTSAYWKLTQLNGNAVTMQQNQDQERHMIMNADDNRLSGFSGCNSFFGEFEAEELLKGEGELKFVGVASTKRACPDSNINEQTYFNVLRDTAFYQINTNSLTLLNKHKKVIALFNAVYL
ncbi:META domain-containing protein [Thalassotalea piscium]|uniref:Heat shock protein HslJ n=1 Tax=Thalassotalea piscium TaxID=1230533 RepID=A0A7X0TVD5_9GAMM|nr:META domain-containing protein [Thalassotalea piscium]MBB6545054.1 heat shock protein HslJ [Thalassotalea piscium]